MKNPTKYSPHGNEGMSTDSQGEFVHVDEYFKLVNRLKNLEHHESTTVGLWATDRPDLVKDPNKIMFQITKSK